MPYRKTVFSNKEIYHILNRGVAKIPIFSSPRDYQRFLNLIDFYRFPSPVSFSHYERLSFERKSQLLAALKISKPLVEIQSYCLMPNHFHLLIKQLQDNGIKTMISNVQNGYAKYFNTKNERPGPLFQSAFRAIRIESEEQLLHVSRYIHLNPSSSFLTKIENLLAYPWSSFPLYVDNKDHNKSSDLINSKQILDLFKKNEMYKDFVLSQAEYQRKLDLIKHLILE